MTAPDAGGAAGSDSARVSTASALPTAPVSPAAPGGSARALVAAIGVLWGLNWPAVRIILEDLPPWTTRAVGLGCGALALFLLAHFGGRRLAVPGGQRLHLVIAGLLNIAGFNILLAFAQLATATSRAVIVTFTMPLWAALLARLVLGERLDVARRLALALGAAGIVILLLPLAIRGGLSIGLLYALGGGFSWAAGTVYLKTGQIGLDPLALAAWQLAVGAAAAGLGALVFEGWSGLRPLHDAAVLALVYHILFAQALAYAVWFSVIARLPAATAALGTLVIPVVGVGSSALILGERPTPADLAGFALILAAAALVLRPAPAPR